MAKYKVGDVVNILDIPLSYEWRLDNHIGKSYSIKEVDSKNKIEDIQTYRTIEANAYFPEDCLELFEEKEVKFTSQQDVMKYLVEGGKITGVDKITDIVYFENGEIRSEEHRVYTVGMDYKAWKPYSKPKPKPWREDIPEQGVLCWVSDYSETRQSVIRLVIQYIENVTFPYRSTDSGFKYAIPVTLEGITKYVYQPSK